MGRPVSWKEKTYGPQRALTLSSRLLVLLRDELGLSQQPKVARLLVNEIPEVIEDSFLAEEEMRPGQLLVLAPEIGQGPSWHHGKLEDKQLKPAQIAKATDHTPRSVERYIRRFEQVRELVAYLDKGPDPMTIARILGCSQQLVAEYLELLPDGSAA